MADLRWLGLHWDGPIWRQSARRGVYATVLSALRRSGWLYPCRCSRRMLADISAPHGAVPVYPGHCRDLGLGWASQERRLPSWRWRLPEGPIECQERFAAGQGRLDGPSQVGDVVLRRGDGFLAYHLATAVDELLFGVTDEKDAEASSAHAPDGVVQQAVRALKDALPDLVVITDVCLCAYTDHGHCGLLDDHGQVTNDPSLEVLARTAVSHADAGADVVAPSDMMDGRVAAIRAALDDAGIELVAERVEDERHVPELIDRGIRLGQGYLFGEPRAARSDDV